MTDSLCALQEGVAVAYSPVNHAVWRFFFFFFQIGIKLAGQKSQQMMEASELDVVSLEEQL